MTEISPATRRRASKIANRRRRQGEPLPSSAPAGLRLPYPRWAILRASAQRTDQRLQEFLNRLQPVNGSWGSGRLLAGTAFSAVWTDDGRLAVGAAAQT